jgi:S-adenosyl methyltransferase
VRLEGGGLTLLGRQFPGRYRELRGGGSASEGRASQPSSAPRVPARDGLEFDWLQAEMDMGGEIDHTVPHSARVWDYWLGGKDNYPVDQAAGDMVLARFAGIADTVRQLRYFTARVVRYLAAEAGVRQFLDIGTGLPFRDPVHEIALSAAGDCRVAYADNDPLVMTFARALLNGPSGAVTHIDGDLQDPAALLTAARDCLDFTRPAAILLMSTLGHIDPRQDDDEAGLLVVGQLKDALPPGGYLAIGDFVARPDLDAALDCYNATGAAPYRARSPGQFTRLFDGLDIAGTAVGPACRWRPEPSPFTVRELPVWGAVGRKR